MWWCQKFHASYLKYNLVKGFSVRWAAEWWLPSEMVYQHTTSSNVITHLVVSLDISKAAGTEVQGHQCQPHIGSGFTAYASSWPLTLILYTRSLKTPEAVAACNVTRLTEILAAGRADCSCSSYINTCAGGVCSMPWLLKASTLVLLRIHPFLHAI